MIIDVHHANVPVRKQDKKNLAAESGLKWCKPLKADP
jgi:hypothetical protein